MKIFFAILSFGCLIGCNNNIIKVPVSPYPISDDSFSVETIAQGFTIPYRITIVEENEYFITDRNDYFVFGSLAYKRLMKYNRKTNETLGLDIEGRVRTIKQLQSGDIIALIERNDLNQSNGKIVRIGQ